MIVFLHARNLEVMARMTDTLRSQWTHLRLSLSGRATDINRPAQQFESRFPHEVDTMMSRPAELIFAIWNNLPNIDVLDAFTEVNRRFNHLIRADTRTRSLG